MAGTNLRSRDGLPFNFVNGLKVRGVDIEDLLPGIEGIPEAGTKYQFAGNGSNTIFTLPVTPYNKDAIEVHVKQLYVHSSDYTLVGDVVTLNEAPPALDAGETYNVEIKVTLTTLNGYVNANRVSFEGENLDDILEKSKPIANYSALRAYAGNATQIRITDPGIAGFFRRDGSASDNGGTVIVDGSGRSWERDFESEVSVCWFEVHASASGIENASALQAAADFCKSGGYTLIGSAGTFNSSVTVQIECSCDLSMMTILVNGNSVSPAIRFGTTTGNATRSKFAKLPIVRNSGRASGMHGAGVGIELANCDTNIIVIPQSTDFNVGVSIGGYGSGFAYNKIDLGFIYSNKINLQLVPGGVNGWCNQNTFYGGRLGTNSTDFAIAGYVGTRQLLLDKGPATSGGPNNNTFIGTSFETNLIEYMIELRGNVTYNKFINCRYEGTNKNVLFETSIASGVSNNEFLGGYQAEDIVFTSSGTGSSPWNSLITNKTKRINASGVAFNISNSSSSGLSAPHFQGFYAGVNALEKTTASNDWSYRIYAQGIAGKRNTDSYSRIELDFVNGRIYYGDGTASSAKYIGHHTSGIAATHTFLPTVDDTLNIGASTLRWLNTYSENFRPGAGSAIWTSGSGSPEGVVSAPVGSMFTRIDGGANTTLYIKESGTGNTGWVAK